MQNGHVTAFTFAVIDVDKTLDLANDIHGSKIIVVPFDGVTFDQENPGPGSAGCPADSAEPADGGTVDASKPADAGVVVDAAIGQTRPPGRSMPHLPPMRALGPTPRPPSEAPRAPRKRATALRTRSKRMAARPPNPPPPAARADWRAAPAAMASRGFRCSSGSRSVRDGGGASLAYFIEPNRAHRD